MYIYLQTDGRFFKMKNKEIRIHDIIDIAINQFLEKGYENVTMEGLAKAANLSKGGLYHHFSRKVEILSAVNARVLGPIQEIMVKIEENDSLTEGLKQFISDYINYWNNNRRELTLYFFTMNVSFSDPQMLSDSRQFAKQEFDYFESLFIRGQKSGIFKNHNARAHAVALISCIDGFLAYLLIDETIPLQETIQEIQKTYIDDLLA